MAFICVKEFNARLNHNISVLQDQFTKNKFCANDYHFIDHLADESHFLIARRFFDILAATLINALPVDQINGVDCYRMTSKGLQAVEVKLVELHTRGIFKTKRNALYYGKEPTDDPNRRHSIRSHFRASYEIYNNLHSKNMPTVLVLFDTENHVFVDAIEMPGNKVIQYLANITDSSGQILREKTTKKRTISLSAFLNHGIKVPTSIDSVGFENWETQLKLQKPAVI